MSEEPKKLSNRELSLELAEVQVTLKDTKLAFQEERENLQARITRLEEEAVELQEKTADAIEVRKKAEEHAKFVERASLEDRQKLKDVEKVLATRQAAVDAALEERDKAHVKRKKEMVKRQDTSARVAQLERELKEVKNGKGKEEEQPCGEESDQDGVATPGNALDATGDSAAVE